MFYRPSCCFPRLPLPEVRAGLLPTSGGPHRSGVQGQLTEGTWDRVGRGTGFLPGICSAVDTFGLFPGVISAVSHGSCFHGDIQGSKWPSRPSCTCPLSRHFTFRCIIFIEL